MDRTGASAIIHRPAVRASRSAPRQFLLRTPGRNGREFAVHAAHRRGIHAASLLWDAAHDRMAQTGRVPRQSETGEPFDAAHGAGGDLPRPSIEPGRRIEEIPEFIGKFEDRPPQSGVVHGYNYHSIESRIRVSDSGDGLVQPLRVVLEPVDEFGRRILPGIFGRSRVFDNIMIERLWRSVKYEEVYLKDYETVIERRDELPAYWSHYNEGRPHQSLDYHTPGELYYGIYRLKE